MIEYDVDIRYEQSIPHHPKSEALMTRMQKFDNFGSMDFLETGGDGDTGETLMYFLDIVFEEDDKKYSGISLVHEVCKDVESFIDGTFDSKVVFHPSLEVLKKKIIEKLKKN